MSVRGGQVAALEDVTRLRKPPELAGLEVAGCIGVPVDLRRRTSHPENIEGLKSWAEEAEKRGFRIPRQKQSSKGQKGRTHRGLTSSGKKIRGLRKS